MYFFPAADSTEWAHIQRVIDDSDYYIIVVGGRYGSLTDDGLSFTEHEYLYARDMNKPILAFIHGDENAIPWGRSEHDPGLRQRLHDFIDRLRSDHLVRTWTTTDGLKAAVATSLTAQMSATPQKGWSRNSDAMPRRSTAFEVVRHHERLRIRADGFDNDVTLDVRAATSGVEVFFRQVAGSGSSTLTDIELLTPSMTLFRPFLVTPPWTKAFVHLGRQLGKGETTTVALREKYAQPGAWDRENATGYYTSHVLQRLDLEVEYPDELRPTSAVWREFQGDASMGDVVDFGELAVDRNLIRFERIQPTIGHNYVIEWTM
jgi:hypothetical protein